MVNCEGQIFLNFGDMFDGKLWLFYNVQFSFLDFLAILKLGFLLVALDSIQKAVLA